MKVGLEQKYTHIWQTTSWKVDEERGFGSWRLPFHSTHNTEGAERQLPLWRPGLVPGAFPPGGKHDPPRTSLPFPGAPEAATAPSSITLTGEEGGHKVTSSSQGGHRGLIQSKGCEPGQCARVEGSKVSQGAQSRQGSAGAQARGPS